MYIIFLIAYLLVAIILVLLIMLQGGKGHDIGGNSLNVRSLLGKVGTNPSGDLVTRLTAVLGVLFFFFSLLLGNISNKYTRKVSILDNSVVSEHQFNNVSALTEEVADNVIDHISE